MRDTLTAAEKAQEQAYRRSQHQSMIARVFRLDQPQVAQPAWPQGFEPMEQGLVIVYAKGGASDHGRVHRASCRTVANIANARGTNHKTSVYVESSAFERSYPSSNPLPQGCAVCGVEQDVTVPTGAMFWGETAEQVRERRDLRARAEKAREEQKEREYAARAEQQRQDAPVSVTTVRDAEAAAGRVLTPEEVERLGFILDHSEALHVLLREAVAHVTAGAPALPMV